MKLLDIVTPDCIKAPLAAENKQAAIYELIDVLASTGRVTDSAVVREAVWQREQIRTTGIGAGLAIPHGKSPGVSSLAMAIGKPARPMDFQAIDNKPVRLIILLASPVDRASDHIQALAHITRLMNIEEFRERVYSSQSASEIYDLLRQQEGVT
jgi:fructose-specific phosphotransferase system IIA component